MSYQEFEENLKKFSEITNRLHAVGDERINALINCYIEQNITTLNDILTASIQHLKKLEHTHTENDIICTQARFTQETSQKLSLSTQRFLSMSLGQNKDNDYNDWLKAHCDLATD